MAAAAPLSNPTQSRLVGGLSPCTCARSPTMACRVVDRLPSPCPPRMISLSDPEEIHINIIHAK
eukprot:5758269-Pleurochrysis_carterae.AAC.1